MTSVGDPVTSRRMRDLRANWDLHAHLEIPQSFIKTMVATVMDRQLASREGATTIRGDDGDSGGRGGGDSGDEEGQGRG